MFKKRATRGLANKEAVQTMLDNEDMWWHSLRDWLPIHRNRRRSCALHDADSLFHRYICPLRSSLTHALTSIRHLQPHHPPHIKLTFNGFQVFLCLYLSLGNLRNLTAPALVVALGTLQLFLWLWNDPFQLFAIVVWQVQLKRVPFIWHVSHKRDANVFLVIWFLSIKC